MREFQSDSRLTKLCRSIQTYGGQGVSKPGVVKHEHSAISSGLYSPRIPDWEDPNGEMLRPVPVVATDTTEPGMEPFSRIDYARPYILDHSIKSRDFGDVPRGWTSILLNNFQAVRQRPTLYYEMSENGSSRPRQDKTLETDQRHTLTSSNAPIIDSRAFSADDIGLNLRHVEDTRKQFVTQQAKTQRQSGPEPAASGQDAYDHSKEICKSSQLHVQNDPVQNKESSKCFTALGRSQDRMDPGFLNKDENTASVSLAEPSFKYVSMPKKPLRDRIALFGNDLISKAGVDTWAAYSATEHTPTSIEARLEHLLQHYAVDLENFASGLHGFDGSTT